MLPDRVSNPGPLTYESGALPIALRGPATQISMLKLVFLKNSWAIWNQNSYESLREKRNDNLYK